MKAHRLVVRRRVFSSKCETLNKWRYSQAYNESYKVLDIDKAYALMAALDRNGMYQESQNGELIISDEEQTNVVSPSEQNVNSQIATLMDLSINGQEYKKYLNNLVDTIRELLKTEDIIINKNSVFAHFGNRPIPIKMFDAVIKDLKFQILSKTGLENFEKNTSKGMQNMILETIIDLYRDPRTLMATTNPTTMAPVHDAVHHVGKGKEMRSHWDAYTDIYVNQTTSVGKKDIGISAVAQKAFYALNFYNYIRQTMNRSTFDLFHLNVPKEWGGSIISLGFPDTKIDLNSLITLYNTLRTANNNQDNGEVTYNGINFIYSGNEYVPTIKYQKSNGEWKTLLVNDRIGDFLTTTVNSAIISSSTDNAKEMMMDLLNATPEILPAYEFLISVGVNLNDAATILTDPIINAIITVSRGNLLKNQKSYSRINSVLTNDGKKEVESILANKGIKLNDEKWEALKVIFKGAQELTILGQSLGINGGIKVEFGEPLLFQLNMERNVKEVTGKSFHLDRFLSNYVPFEDSVPLIPGSYSEQMIALYEQNKTQYNILDLIYRVPHFHSMFTVPLQFKNTMQLLSKDIDNVYRIAASQAYKVWWNQDGLRQLLRAVTDRKIADFFIKYPFKYNSPFIINANGVEKENNDELSTNTVLGLLTLKTYIEREIIIKELKTRFSDNEFVMNLTPSSTINALSKTEVPFFGSKVVLTDPQNEDRVHIIKKGFDVIKNIEINGHTILDWMFVYDLLVNKHSLGGNSMPVLFTNGVDFSTENAITKWIEYLNDYDSSHGHYKTSLTPFNNLPIHTAKMTKDHEDDFAPDADVAWWYKAKHLPLFISKSKGLIEDVLVDRATVYEAFKRGLLRVNKC